MITGNLAIARLGVGLLANGKSKMQSVCAAMRKLVYNWFGIIKYQ